MLHWATNTVTRVERPVMRMGDEARSEFLRAHIARSKHLQHMEDSEVGDKGEPRKSRVARLSSSDLILTSRKPRKEETKHLVFEHGRPRFSLRSGGEHAEAGQRGT